MSGETLYKKGCAMEDTKTDDNYNYVEAFHFFHDAVDIGYVPAHVKLGDIYADTCAAVKAHVKMDYYEAFTHYILASTLNSLNVDELNTLETLVENNKYEEACRLIKPLLI